MKANNRERAGELISQNHHAANLQRDLEQRTIVRLVSARLRGGADKMKLRIISAIGAILLGPSAAQAQSNAYCAGLADLLETDTLYAASCNDRRECLRRVVEKDGLAYLQKEGELEAEPLARWKPYNFIYKVSPGGAPNSLVVVQLKWSDAAPKLRERVVGVNLRRKAFNFACYGYKKNIPSSEWPPSEVPRDKIPAVPYADYDHYHRYGYAAGDADSLLHNHFHVRYFNGETCVATTDTMRRAQFLMHDAKDFRGRIAAFFARFGWDVGPPSTEELAKMRKYERLKLIVSNYQKRPDAGGCFVFSAKSGTQNTSVLDVTIRDMEAQVRYPLFEVSRSWSFDVK